MSTEAYKKVIQTIIDKFAHICSECRDDAEKYYGSKLGEVSSLEKECVADASACKDVTKDEGHGCFANGGGWRLERNKVPRGDADELQHVKR